MTNLLIIMDMNTGFARKGALYSPRTEKLIAPIQAFAKKAKDENWKILGLSDFHSSTDIELECFPPHCMEDSEESKFLPELAQFCDKILKKNTTGCFFEIQEAAKEDPFYDLSQYEEIHFSGCCTDLCIFNAAVIFQKYFEHEFHQNRLHRVPKIVVRQDLVDTYDMPGHNAEEINAFFFGHHFAINGIEVTK